MPKVRNGSIGDSKPGSLDCESGIPPLSYCAKERVSKAKCSSCYKTSTLVVRTHTAKKLKIYHKKCVRQAYTWKDTQRQDPHQMDAQYQERYENIWHRRQNDGRQEDVVKYGGKCRHTLVYQTQGEKATRLHVCPQYYCHNSSVDSACATV